MKTTWDRIHTWLRANAPKVYADLRKGASDKKIAATEAALGVEFPEDVKASYRIHDGQACRKNSGMRSFLHGFEWLPLSDVVSGWRTWKQLLDEGHIAPTRCKVDGPVRKDWYHPGWVPIAHGTFDEACLDFAPAKGGKVGQVIRVIRDEEFREVLADNFADWLEDFVEELDEGLYVWADEYDGIVDSEMIEDEGDKE